MAKRIILLLDGTWNDQDVGPADTNIVRLQQIIARSLQAASKTLHKAALATGPAQKVVSGFAPEGGPEHIVFYERGVGTGAFDQIRGGVFGDGLAANVRRAYKFLSWWYEEGDQIFIFGFSRGAYTARSLVGYAAAAGLLRRDLCTAENEGRAWDFYRTNPNDRLPGAWAALEPCVHDRDTFRIACIGVFDTVGALGVPLRLFNRLNRGRFEFHNVELSSITLVNLHAIAIDEHRKTFLAAPWRKPKFKQFATRTEQVWFPGAHADIGGGYIDEEKRATDHALALDDITLDWMLKRVRAHYPDFAFDPDSWKTVDSDWALAEQHEPRRHGYRLWPRAYRSIANCPIWELGSRETAVGRDRHADPIAEMIHVSALERLGVEVMIDGASPRYAPANLVQVLDKVDATYEHAHRPPHAGPDIRVVDWSGEEFDPAHSKDRTRVRTLVAEARARLG